MEEVFLNSDILIHYYALQLPMPVRYHNQARAVMKRVLAGDLTAHISDIVLFQVAQVLEQLPRQQLSPEPDPNAPSEYISPGYYGPLHMRKRVKEYLVPLLECPNIIHPNKEKWYRVFEIYAGDDVSLEAAYNAATVEVMNDEERRNIQGIVSFDEEFEKIAPIIIRIDPFTL